MRLLFGFGRTSGLKTGSKRKIPNFKQYHQENLFTVAQVFFNSIPLNLTFRKALVGDKLDKWNELVSRIEFL